MTTKHYLTKSGNILRLHADGTANFSNAKGEFLRICVPEEAEFVASVAPEISFPDVANAINWESVAIWKLLWETSTNDYSEYEEGSHTNGGKYAFYTKRMYFARLTRRGWKFCSLEVHSTSAEFDYDQLNSSFQDTAWSRIFGCEEEFGVYTDADGSHLVLDQIANEVDGLPFSVSDYDIYPDEDDSSEVVWIERKPELTELRQRVLRLREIGYTSARAAVRRTIANRKNRR